jgi:putative endonuclease
LASRYDVGQLVWYEYHEDIAAAIACERAIKAWQRSWKPKLIEGVNTDWRDL